MSRTPYNYFEEFYSTKETQINQEGNENRAHQILLGKYII
jgi:hypothetical protein